MKQVERTMIVEAILQGCIYSGHYFCVYAVTICVTYYNRDDFRAEKIFVMLLLFASLESVFFWFLQKGVKMVSELIICVERMKVK